MFFNSFSFDLSIWIEATIEKVMPDYLTISFSGARGPQTLIIERDSEKLAKGLF
jgi:hypothetical protein